MTGQELASSMNLPEPLLSWGWLWFLALLPGVAALMTALARAIVGPRRKEE